MNRPSMIMQKRDKTVEPFPQDLSQELARVVEQLEETQRRFDMVEDEDLLEALIYEQNALMARHRYLHKLALVQSEGDGRDPVCLTHSISQDF